MSCGGETLTEEVEKWLVVGCLASSMSESIEDARDEVLCWGGADCW
jgi:hypothetical protein